MTLRVGEGAGRFLGDLHNGESDEVMRENYKRGEYGKLDPEWVRQCRRLAGRKPRD